jgi:hypothetical protein
MNSGRLCQKKRRGRRFHENELPTSDASQQGVRPSAE